jgi:hypothetical protein
MIAFACATAPLIWPPGRCPGCPPDLKSHENQVFVEIISAESVPGR